MAGSESAFVGMMNQRAQELGLLDTNFVNCTGLDDAPEAAEHLTTAHDIAVISRELLKHDRIRDLHDHLDGHGARRQIRPFEHE